MAEEEVKGVAEEGTEIAEKGASIGRQMRVMVAIDESECSRYALEWTLDRLSEPIAASKLTVFTAQPMAPLTYIPAASSFGAIHSFGAISASPELIQTLQRHHMKVALGLLERAKAICDRKGVAAETITEVGDPRDVICAAVEKLNIDLLIMQPMMHGGPLQRIFLGSVSNHCVHHAKCSVLVVRK